MPPVRLTIRQGPYNHLLRAPDGEVGRYIHGQLRAVEVAAKQRCPVDEGELRASSVIEVRPGPRGPEGSLIFTANHAIFVHEGRRPGSWPPPQALERWAGRHGIPTYLVGRAIFLKGIKGVPYLWTALESVIARARRRRP